MSEVKIKLGNKVRDRVSGLTGYVTSRSDQINGNVQFGVQPPGDGNEMKEAHYVDHFMLEVVEEGLAADLPPIDDSVTVKLQDKVRVKTTGLEGTVTEKITFQNGCVYFIVQPPIHKTGDNKGLAPKPSVVQHILLEVLTPAEKKPAAERVETKRTTGGPNRSMRDVMGR